MSRGTGRSCEAWWVSVVLLVLTAGAGCATGPSLPKSADPHWIEISNVRLFLVSEEDDCGVAALTSVLTFWRPDLSLSEVRSEVQSEARRPMGPELPRQGVAAGTLRTVALAHGVRAFLVKGTWDDLVHEIRSGRPVIIGLAEQHGSQRMGHYVVIAGINPVTRTLLVADPRGSWRRVEEPMLMTEWRPANQLALVILPIPLLAGEGSE